MPSPLTTERSLRSVGIARVIIGVLVMVILFYAYALRISVGDANPFDFFGYFTNQTALLTSVILVSTGILAARGARTPGWLTALRAVAVTCMIVVGVIYNVLVPGTGSAPAWISIALHVVLPLIVLVDWIIAPPSRPLPWRRVWLVIPYPLAWLSVVLLRGITDGWVPYGFLLPERGALSLWLHIAGLVAALLAAAGLVWALSRVPARSALAAGDGSSH